MVQNDIQTVLNLPVDQLDLSIRASMCLNSSNIKTVADLIMYTADDLSQIRSFGRTSLREIKRKLADLGLSLNRRLYMREFDRMVDNTLQSNLSPNDRAIVITLHKLYSAAFNELEQIKLEIYNIAVQNKKNESITQLNNKYNFNSRIFLPIEYVERNISTRTKNKFKKWKDQYELPIRFVGDLLQVDPGEIYKMRGISKTTVMEIQILCRNMGFTSLIYPFLIR